jgi:hypothetical protein
MAKSWKIIEKSQRNHGNSWKKKQWTIMEASCKNHGKSKKNHGTTLKTS